MAENSAFAVSANLKSATSQELCMQLKQIRCVNHLLIVDLFGRFVRAVDPDPERQPGAIRQC